MSEIQAGPVGLTTGLLTTMACSCSFDTPWEGQTVWNPYVHICGLHADYPDFSAFKAALRTEQDADCAELIRRFNSRFVEEMRAGYATLGNRIPTRGSLLLTTTGSRSGKARISAVSFQRRADTFVVIATTGGRDRNPDWYFNIRSHAQVEIEVANRTFPALAREAVGAERDHLIALSVLIRPTHEAMFERAIKLQRQIPLIAITPEVNDLIYAETPG